MSVILHIMGPTCAGKSTFIRQMLAIDPKHVGAVEVGKMLRGKYGARHFNGQAAPEHTQDEAWEIYSNSVRLWLDAGKRLILVDGQPRDVTQARKILDFWEVEHLTEFLLIHADHEIREARARADRQGDNLELTLARLHNDYRNCYTVMVELLKRRRTIHVFDSSDGNMDELIENVLIRFSLQ